MCADDEWEATQRKVLGVAESRLRESPDLAEHPITCQLREGTLTLRGRVPTYSLKQAARSLVQGLDGVQAVDNQIDVIPVPVSDGPSDDRRTAPGDHRYHTD